MPELRFLPTDLSLSVEPNTKILVAANRNKIPIRFGCAACRCGTCAVRVTVHNPDQLTPIKENEHSLLAHMKLPTDGTVRLACQTRIIYGNATIDLTFQSSYSPDAGEDLPK